MSRNHFLARVHAAIARLCAASDGDLSPENALELFETLSLDGERLGVAALTTVALGCIEPQPAATTIGPLRTLLDAAIRRAAGDDEPLPLGLLQQACAVESTSHFHHEQLYAASAVGWALLFLDDPSPEIWRRILRAFRNGSLGWRRSPATLFEGWMYWFEDAVLVPDDRSALEVLRELRRSLEHPLDDLPPVWELEVVGYEEGDFEVMLQSEADPTSYRNVGRFGITLDGSTLNVVVSESRGFLLDKLRVEYVVTNLTLRHFLRGYFDGRYDRIEYRIEATGETWGRDDFPGS